MSTIVEQWLAAHKHGTRQAYLLAIRDYTAAVGPPEKLLEARVEARQLARSYKDNALARGLARSTVNLRLGALGSLVKYARSQGLVDWRLAIGEVPVPLICSGPCGGFEAARGAEGCGP